MYLAQLIDGNVGVNGGGVDVFVAEYGLDVAQLCAILQHVGSHGMAEQMATASALDTGLVEQLFNLVAQVAWGDGVAVGIAEQVLFDHIGEQVRPSLIQIAAQPHQRPLADGYTAILIAFPLPHKQAAPLEVDV